MDPRESEFWNQAARQGLPWFRWLRRPVTSEELDHRFVGTQLEDQWIDLKRHIQPGDQLWPFQFHVRRYLGMRQGYLLLRDGTAVGGIVTMLS